MGPNCDTIIKAFLSLRNQIELLFWRSNNKFNFEGHIKVIRCHFWEYFWLTPILCIFRRSELIFEDIYYKNQQISFLKITQRARILILNA